VKGRPASIGRLAYGFELAMYHAKQMNSSLFDKPGDGICTVDFFQWIADFGQRDAGTLRIIPRSILRVKQCRVRFEIDRNKNSLVIIDQRSGLRREFTFIKLRVCFYGADATGRVVLEFKPTLDLKNS
jgi:hypothetical protein